MDMKGITWAANIYQKFEAMCLEVEEIMYQDTVKYVENQVQTVGASVKKFYSEVVDDLLPPSSLDPGKVANSEFILEQINDLDVCKKQKPVFKKEPLKVDIGQLRKRAKSPGGVEKNHVAVNSNLGNHMADNPCPSPVLSSPETGDRARSLSPGKYSNETMPKSLAGPAASLVSSEQAAYQSTEVLKRNFQASHEETPLACLASSEAAQGDLDGESTDETETRNEAIPGSSDQAFSSNNSFLESELAQNSERQKSLSSSEGFSIASRDISWDNSTVSFGASSMQEDFFSEVYEEISFSSSEHGTIDRSDKAKLEESCIFVNGDELRFVSAATGKSRPYKNKIRNALSSRKRGSRAQEYKQLAAHFASSAKSNDELATTSGVVLGASKSSGSSRVLDQGESEWEIL